MKNLRRDGREHPANLYGCVQESAELFQSGVKREEVRIDGDAGKARVAGLGQAAVDRSDLISPSDVRIHGDRDHHVNGLDVTGV